MEVARPPGGFLFPHQMYRPPPRPAATAGGPRVVTAPHEFYDGSVMATRSVPPPTEPINRAEYLYLRGLASYDGLAASVSVLQAPDVAPPSEPTNLAGLVTMYRRLAAYSASTLPGPPGAPVTVDLNLLVGERDVVGDAYAHAHGGFGAVPASGDAMAALPETTVGEGEVPEEECAVCLDGYEAGDRMRTMPCSHGFHGHCILGWLAVSRLCPLCRFALPAEVGLDAEDDGVAG